MGVLLKCELGMVAGTGKNKLNTQRLPRVRAAGST